MKVLADSSSSEIRGGFTFPLDSSIAGHYIIDVPDVLNVTPSTMIVSDLITAKLNAFKSLHPTLTTSFQDEFLTTSQIDTSLSVRISTGVNKRTSILPGGSLMTTQLVTAGAISKIFLHYYMFNLYSHTSAPGDVTPGPNRLLYNYDSGTSQYVDFLPANVTVDVMDSIGTSVLITPTPDTEVTYVSGGVLTFRLRFTNISATKVYFPSDWIFLCS